MGQEKEILRLEHFRVKALFGEFNHCVPFNINERITALIGPNGLGKTACLRLINGLFRHQWSIFSTTEFDSVEFLFSDGSRVLVDHATPDDSVGEVSDSSGVSFHTIRGDDVEDWSPRLTEQSPARFGRIDAYLPFLTRTGARTWTHDDTRQAFSLQEVIETYGDLLPDQILALLNTRPPPLLASITDLIDCHLIETQRLLVLQSDEPRRPSSAVPSTLAISKKAQTLKSIISRELATYASISQSLDRSFPRRVVQQGPINPSDSLTESLADLDQLRNGLTEAGILDFEAEDALPAFDEVNPAIAAVLSVYVADTRRKLDVLATLRARILLFIELIDNRFKPKSVVVDKSVGFVVKRSCDHEVPLEKLSSGEQHQLVLFFELLFELKANALILIDEPELSLHVAWQKKFIRDLKRIIHLNGFDVLLATHSPQLIGEWDELVVELGDVDPE